MRQPVTDASRELVASNKQEFQFREASQLRR